MALEKEIIFDNGVNIKYYKISEMELDNTMKKVKVVVSCYTNEDYRLKEKENLTNQNRYEELFNLILEENKKEPQFINTEQVEIWSEEANSLVGKFVENLSLVVLKTPLEFENVVDLSLSNIYNLIKQNELFKDSENV